MAERQYLRPYVDTSVYLAAINNEYGRAEVAREILDAANHGVIQIVASTFVVAEVIRPRWETANLPEEKEKIINEVFANKQISWVEVDYPLAVEARRLARLHGLKPADAVHLASAMRGRADILLRWDYRFKVDAGITELDVCDPYWWGEATLPLT
jgi:predicted nucleic acid-binding protein